MYYIKQCTEYPVRQKIHNIVTKSQVQLNILKV